MTEITDTCGHGAENCVTHGPFRSRIRLARKLRFIVIQDSKIQEQEKTEGLGLRLGRYFNLHALGGSPHPGIVVARFLYHLVDARVVMIGIVME